jgi:hypothetical protein
MRKALSCEKKKETARCLRHRIKTQWERVRDSAEPTSEQTLASPRVMLSVPSTFLRQAWVPDRTIKVLRSVTASRAYACKSSYSKFSPDR